jgi:hypothetical protein
VKSLTSGASKTVAATITTNAQMARSSLRSASGLAVPSAIDDLLAAI